jgi:DNA-binding CsgD family transcriptional regulator
VARRDNRPNVGIASLSLRELEIANLISHGLATKEIMVKLNLSRRTIEGHRYRIFEKLQVSNMAALTRKMVEAEYAGKVTLSA